MGTPADDRKPIKIGELLAWIVPLLVYGRVVARAAYHNRELLSPDAVAYIRRAIYLSRGEFGASVSGYWSPLLSWSIAPLLWTGLDPVYAARVALALWGALLILAIHAFLRSFTAWNWRWRLAVLSVLSLIVVVRAVRQITPDVALATCLMAYFAALMSPRFQRSGRWQFMTGAIGGFAYLSKSYGLPFVALHLPATLIFCCLVKKMQARKVPAANRSIALGTLARCLTGWLLVIAPWTAILSLHYGRFTTNTVGGLARSMVGPNNVSPEIAYQNRLRWFTPPHDPFVAQIENPDATAFASWSPFESGAMFRYQLRMIWRHALRCGHYVGEFAAMKVSLLVVLAGAIVATRWLRIEGLSWSHATWLLATCALFCGGFLLVYLEARYIDTLVLSLIFILGVSILHGLFRTHERIALDVFRGLLGAALCAAFAWPLIADFRELFHPQTASIYRQVADLLEARGLEGTTASTNRYAGMYLALHLGAKQQTIVALTLDHPQHREMERTLLAGKPRSIILWAERRDPIEEQRARAYASALIKRLGWIRQFRMNKWGRRIEVYAPVSGDPDPWTPEPYVSGTVAPSTLP